MLRRATYATLSIVACGATIADAGWKERHAAAGSRPPHRSVAPNGVVVPAWATRRMEESPVPLAGYSWGRRPWAFPLAQQDTPAANMARASQLGIGAGPVPGYTNGPPLGNYPTAPSGPTASTPPRRSLTGLPAVGYPFNLYGGGAN